MADTWFKNGVHFKCEGVECGDCCSGRWGPGFVWLKMSDIERLMAHLNTSLEDFGRQYVREVYGQGGSGYSLIEKPNNDCVFYVEGQGCQVYDARPDQCRSYPFWREVMKSKESWDAEQEHCPGINCGEACDKVSAKEIKARRSLHPREDGQAP